MATRKSSRKAGRKSTRRVKKSSAPSSWRSLVSKVYSELKRKDKEASLGDAMKEASRRRKSGKV